MVRTPWLLLKYSVKGCCRGKVGERREEVESGGGEKRGEGEGREEGGGRGWGERRERVERIGEG